MFPIVGIIFLLRNKDDIVDEFLDRTRYIKAYRTDKSVAQMDARFIFYRKFSAIYEGIKLKSVA